MLGVFEVCGLRSLWMGAGQGPYALETEVWHAAAYLTFVAGRGTSEVFARFTMTAPYWTLPTPLSCVWRTYDCYNRQHWCDEHTLAHLRVAHLWNWNRGNPLSLASRARQVAAIEIIEAACLSAKNGPNLPVPGFLGQDT